MHDLRVTDRQRIARALLAYLAPCVRVRLFSAGAPVTARPSRSRQKQNIDPGKLHRFTSNVGIAPLTDHYGWNGEAFPVSCGVNFMTFGFLNTSQSTFSFLISNFCRQNCTLFKKRHGNSIIWCTLVIITMLLSISCVI